MEDRSTLVAANLQAGIAAVQAGRKSQGLKHLVAVLKYDPQHIDAMLWLAYAVPQARDSRRILERALELDPDNRRVQAGLRWANKQLAAEANPSPTPKPARPWLSSRLWILGLATVMVLLVALAGILLFITPESLAAWRPAQTVSVPKPAVDVVPTVSVVEPAWAAEVMTAAEPDTVTVSGPPAAPAPPVQPPVEAAPSVPAVETDLSLLAEQPRLPAPLISEPSAPAAVDESLLAHQPEYPGQKWIEVDLTNQAVTAWEGNVPVMSFIVSTGLPGTPTVPGKFTIYQKLVSTRMTGPGYNLPNVPYTMYYHKGYALHGAYWHTNFGQPMSHGCVNFDPDEIKALFEWADPVIPPGKTHVLATADNPGTLVVVHH